MNKSNKNPVQRMMDALGYGQHRLARESGVSQAYISGMVKKNRIPASRVMSKLKRFALKHGYKLVADDFYSEVR